MPVGFEVTHNMEVRPKLQKNEHSFTAPGIRRQLPRVANNMGAKLVRSYEMKFNAEITALGKLVS